VAFVIRPFDEVIGRFPVAIIDENNRIVSFVERPRDTSEAKGIFNQIKAQVIKETAERLGVPCLPVNASYYVLLREIFNAVPKPSYSSQPQYDFGKLMFKRMPPERMFAYFIMESVRRNRMKMKNEWTDMATPSDFWLANWLFIKLAANKIPGAYNHEHNLRQGTNVRIDDTARVQDCVIGDNVVIGPGSEITKSVIGNNCHLTGIKISKSVVLPWSLISVRSAASPMMIEEGLVGGHRPLIIDGFEHAVSATGSSITPLPSGELVIERLNISPEQRRLAGACFEKMGYCKNGVEIKR
jgi:NDP-sugar pyrophosphorylase family protein